MSVSTASGLPTRKRSIRFDSSGTWTVPAGVFYAEAEVVGGGAGSTGSTNDDGGAGSDSSVAFTGQTITGKGSPGNPASAAGSSSFRATAGRDLVGEDARLVMGGANSSYGGGYFRNQQQAPQTRGGAAVTPGSSITVTVGAGGSSTKNGGSGYAIIYYEV